MNLKTLSPSPGLPLQPHFTAAGILAVNCWYDYMNLIFFVWYYSYERPVSNRESMVSESRNNHVMEYKVRGFTFGIAPKVTKGLGRTPPKAEKPGDIPKIRKLATLKQYGFFNGIPPGFSPTERFFRQRPGGYGSYEGLQRYHLMEGTISFRQGGGGTNSFGTLFLIKLLL